MRRPVWGCAANLPGAVVLEVEQTGRDLSGNLIFTDRINPKLSFEAPFSGTVSPLGAVEGAATFTHPYTGEVRVYAVALSVSGGTLAGTVANDELLECGMSARGKLFYRVGLTYTP